MSCNDYNKHPDHSRIENELHELFNKYVPGEGHADTVGGEVVRAAMRVLYRWYNDGDRVGEGYGKETVNPPVRYLKHILLDQFDYSLLLFDKLYGGMHYDMEYDLLVLTDIDSIITFLREHDDLFELPNTEDMYDFRDDEEDVDDEWDGEGDEDDDEYENEF